MYVFSFFNVGIYIYIYMYIYIFVYLFTMRRQLQAPFLSSRGLKYKRQAKLIYDAAQQINAARPAGGPNTAARGLIMGSPTTPATLYSTPQVAPHN